MVYSDFIRVDKEIKNSIKKIRRYQRETYGDVLKRILKKIEDDGI